MISTECPIKNSALKFPGETAIYEHEQRISYFELDKRVNSIVNILLKKGVSPDMRIAIVSENSSEYIILIFALLRIGCAVVPVNFRFTTNEMNRIVDGMGINMVISGISKKKFNLSERTVLKFNEIFTKEKTLQPTGSVKTTINGKTIVLTSGSTGEPKGVILTTENHYYSALGANLNIYLEPGDRWYLILPLFHVGGLGILFRAFLAGAGIVMASGSANGIYSDIVSYGTTHVSMVSAQLGEFLLSCEKEAKKVPGTLKCVLAGGSAIPESNIKKCLALGIPLYKTYGMSEMASQVTTSAGPVNKDNLSASGSLLKYRELSVSSGSEILVRGKTLFEGYILNGEFSAPGTDENGWFHTGDKGYLAGDRELVVIGREDNMFISGGENIYPEEIEKELTTIDPIVEAVVVPVDSRKYGKRPVAFIGCGEREISRSKIVSELQKNLPSFKIPDKFYRIDESRPGFLKRNRLELKDMAESGTDLHEISD